MEKGFISRIFIIIFILALAALPVMLVFATNQTPHKQYTLQQDKNALATLAAMALSITPTPSASPTPTTKVAPPLPSLTATSKEAKTTATPTAVPTKEQPKMIASVVQSEAVYNWTNYKSGAQINSFSFTYPKGWKVQYKKDNTSKNVYKFLFSQPSGNQVMTIQVYPYATSAQVFIDKNYNGKLISEAFTTIGIYTVYRVSPLETLSETDPMYTDFGSRGLVLGKKYAYTLSFDAASDHSMINLIEQVIWPSFTFK